MQYFFLVWILFWFNMLIGWFLDVLRVSLWLNGLENGIFGQKTCRPDFPTTTVVAGIWAGRRHIVYHNGRRVVCLFFPQKIGAALQKIKK